MRYHGFDGPGGVAISDGGGFIAIGSPNAGSYYRGEVKVHKYNDAKSSWEQIGQTFQGDANEEYMGVDVSLSQNGRHFALGSLGNQNNLGSVKLSIFCLFDALEGSNAEDGFGMNVDLSATGKILAVGANSYVKVFNCWKDPSDQTNRCNPREGSFHDFGLRKIALSSDGYTSVVGSPEFDSAKGKVALYGYDDQKKTVESIDARENEKMV